MTLEIQSYGPESLAGSKVVEYLHVSALPNMSANGSFADPNKTVGPIIGPVAGQLMGPPARPPPASVHNVARPPQVGLEAPVIMPNMPSGGVFALPSKFLLYLF